MRVHVDEAGGDDEPLGVDLALGLPDRHAADRDDPIARDGHVAVKPRIAAAIDNAAIANDQIVQGLVASNKTRDRENRDSDESGNPFSEAHARPSSCSLRIEHG